MTRGRRDFAQGSTAIALALALPACGQQGIDGGDAAETGVIRAALAIRGDRHDVTAVHYKIVGASSTCRDTAIAEATSALDIDVPLAGDVPYDDHLVTGSGTHAAAEGTFVLPRGNYRVCATPMHDASPSEECAPAETVVDVPGQWTREVMLVSQCRGDTDGLLDAVVALNSPPKIKSLDIAPSKFITLCETATITVDADDPDGDAISVTWQIGSKVSGSSPVLGLPGPVGTFSTDTPGVYTLQVKATDVHGASTWLYFYIHVSAERCDCTCPDGSIQLPDGECATSYDIDADRLINQEERCDDTDTHRYGCGDHGFQWHDLGRGLSSVRRVDVALESGIDCSFEAGVRAVSLNGAAIGNFDPIGSCTCDSEHGLASFPDVNFSSYVLGGVNSVTISAPSCDGLSRSAELGGAFARVTVVYSCEPSLCAGVTCAPPDACHVAGACDPRTGLCTNPNAPDDTACDDGDPTTAESICVSGACVPESPCGNGRVGPGEECDDGGHVNGDGCSASCQIEGTRRFLYTVREEDDVLRRFDLRTRKFEDVGPLGVSFDIGELAWEEATGTLWMIDGRASNGLYTVDIATGAASLVGIHGVDKMFGLGLDPRTGNLYGSARGSQPGFYQLDRATGAATLLGTPPRNYDGMAYDTTRDQLVGFVAGYGALLAVDVANGAASLLAYQEPTNAGGFAYDPIADQFWEIDQDGFLYTYDPTYDYMQTIITSQLGAHDGLTLVMPAP
ncbi:PKD domain-containing protein [Sorangium sp. So ce426]|uniref:PKD domain-containing protein n=1 Tax=Sorangium sp. So ce426 TaxID=3133312 RepID=UPI003F5B1B95